MTQQEYENKIKELQDELEQLKKAKIEAEQPKLWKPKYEPKYGDKYWYIDGCSDTRQTTWNDYRTDAWDYLIGNCFKTVEEAEEHKKQIEYTARYKNYIEEHSAPIRWNNEVQKKYYAVFKCEDSEIGVDFYNTWKFQGAIYASSEQIILDAIKEIGEDNFKKYVLGVK